MILHDITWYYMILYAKALLRLKAPPYVLLVSSFAPWGHGMDWIDGSRGISLASAEEIDQWFDTARYSKFEVWMVYQCLSSIIKSQMVKFGAGCSPDFPLIIIPGEIPTIFLLGTGRQDRLFCSSSANSEVLNFSSPIASPAGGRGHHMDFWAPLDMKIRDSKNSSIANEWIRDHIHHPQVVVYEIGIGC